MFTQIFMQRIAQSGVYPRQSVVTSLACKAAIYACGLVPGSQFRGPDRQSKGLLGARARELKTRSGQPRGAPATATTTTRAVVGWQAVPGAPDVLVPRAVLAARTVLVPRATVISRAVPPARAVRAPQAVLVPQGAIVPQAAVVSPAGAGPQASVGSRAPAAHDLRCHRRRHGGGLRVAPAPAAAAVHRAARVHRPPVSGGFLRGVPGPRPGPGDHPGHPAELGAVHQERGGADPGRQGVERQPGPVPDRAGQNGRRRGKFIQSQVHELRADDRPLCAAARLVRSPERADGTQSRVRPRRGHAHHRHLRVLAAHDQVVRPKPARGLRPVQRAEGLRLGTVAGGLPAAGELCPRTRQPEPALGGGHRLGPDAGDLAAKGIPVVDGEFVNFMGGYYWPRSTQMVTRYFEYLKYHHIGVVAWSLQPGVMTATNDETTAVSEPQGAGRLFMRYFWGRLPNAAVAQPVLAAGEGMCGERLSARPRQQFRQCL